MTDADVIAYLRTHDVAALLVAARVIRHRGAGGSRRGVCAWGREQGPDLGLVRCVVLGAEPDDGLWVAYYGGAPLGGTDRAPVLLAAAWALVEAAAAADGYVWDVGVIR
jgi:hypothetical protein